MHNGPLPFLRMHFHDSNEISLPHRARHCEVLGAYMNMVQNHLYTIGDRTELKKQQGLRSVPSMKTIKQTNDHVSLICLKIRVFLNASYQLSRECYRPSLNTQSCIRRPLCGTFRFEIWVLALKKPVFSTFSIFFNKKIKNFIKAILCNFSMRLLKYF